MRRLFFVFACIFVLSSCSNIVVEEDSVSESQGDYIVTPTESKFVAFNSSTSSYTVAPSDSDITISGDIGGKTIYYAVVNTLSKNIPSELVRYISDSANRSVLQNHDGDEDFFDDDCENHGVCHHGYSFHPKFVTNSAKSVSENATEFKNQISYEVGKTKKEIYTAVSLENYELKTATLYAFNDVCNVWLVDGDKYASLVIQNQVAEKYAEKFKAIYPLIRNVFGKESDSIYTSVYGAKSSMNSVSETGTKVNIVIYDLFGDNRIGSTVGFFSSMDYYKNGLQFSNATVDHSNEGKFFYIDSFFAVRKFEETLSTLAHEFQHMINFGVKTMNGISCDQNFNEMLSMLCEDMMQEFLGISDKNSPKQRLSRFALRYYQTGIREYDDSIQSYANAYAFGAWLTRRFGGASLVKEMMANGKADNSCIASAVNSVSGNSYSFDEIFSQFVDSCIGGENDEQNFASQNPVRFEANGGYDYPMNALDFYAPKIFGNAAVKDISASYGMLLKSYGEIEEDATSVNLKFTSESGMTNSGVLIYIFVK